MSTVHPPSWCPKRRAAPRGSRGIFWRREQSHKAAELLSADKDTVFFFRCLYESLLLSSWLEELAHSQLLMRGHHAGQGRRRAQGLSHLQEGQADKGQPDSSPRTCEGAARRWSQALWNVVGGREAMHKR